MRRRLAAGMAAALAASLLLGCGRDEPGAPDEASLRAALARANDLASRHRINEALAAIDQVLAGGAGPAATPRSAAVMDLLERKARLLITLGRPREASGILEEVVQAKPHGPASRWLARALLEAGDCARAVSLIEGLQGPAFLDSLVDYGTALAAEGRLPEATAATAAALTGNPWNEPAYLELGRILVRAGRPLEGGAFLERYRSGDAFRRIEQEALALESAGSEARALLVRSRGERARGRLFEAMELANRALAKDSRLGEAYLELADLSIFLAKPVDAVRVLEGLGREPRVLRALAEAHEAAGDGARAAEARAAAGAPDPGRAGESGAAEAPASAALEAARAAARERIRDLPLSGSVPALLPLAGALIEAGKLDDARALSLFLLRLQPSERGAVLAVIAAFDRPEDAFVRLWALARRPDPDLVQRFEVEALRLGLEPPILKALLQGTPVPPRRSPGG